jgi:hypothetical protein
MENTGNVFEYCNVHVLRMLLIRGFLSRRSLSLCGKLLFCLRLRRAVKFVPFLRFSQAVPENRLEFFDFWRDDEPAITLIGIIVIVISVVILGRPEFFK